MTKYHPALVGLHWLMAFMILMALYFGKIVLGSMDNADPEKVEGLFGHMTAGLVLGGLLVLRLTVRVRSEKPPSADAGNAILNWIGRATHWALYFLVALMVLSGLGTAITGGLFPIVFGASGDAIPAGLNDVFPRIAHAVLSELLIVLLLLHVVAALYHQFILRDGLFKRMWFGKRRKVVDDR